MNTKAEQAAQVLDFFSENGVNLLNFAVLEAGEGGKTSMMGGKHPRERAEVEKCAGWATARNIRGANVYFRPARHDTDGVLLSHPVVFLDDLSPAKAAGIAKKYRSLIVETSSGNFQAWIVTSQPLDESERREVQGSLCSLIGGDPGSVSGEHFGRFPGYSNNKLGRGGYRVAVRHRNASGPVLDVTPHLSAAPTLPPKGGRVPSSFTPATADGADESKKEIRFAVARIRAGDSDESVTRNIAERAQARGKYSGDAKRCDTYASRTVRVARSFAANCA